jgi:hypothetical protein
MYLGVPNLHQASSSQAVPRTDLQPEGLSRPLTPELRTVWGMGAQADGPVGLSPSLSSGLSTL